MVTTTTATTPTGTGLVADPNAPEGGCRVLGCGRDANKRCRGLCKTHYNRAYTLGREALDSVALPPMSQAERSARRATTTATGRTTTGTALVAEASASVALAGRPANNRALRATIAKIRAAAERDTDGDGNSRTIGTAATVGLRRLSLGIDAVERELRELRATLCHAVGHPSAEDLAGVEGDGPLTDQEIAAEVRLVVRDLRALRRSIAARVIGAELPEGEEPPSDTELVSWVGVLHDLSDRQRAEVVELLGLPAGTEWGWDDAMTAFSQIVRDGYAHRCALHVILGGDEGEDPGAWDRILADVRQLSDDLDEAGKPQDPEYYVELAASAYETRARNLRVVASTRCVR